MKHKVNEKSETRSQKFEIGFLTSVFYYPSSVKGAQVEG